MLKYEDAEQRKEISNNTCSACAFQGVQEVREKGEAKGYIY